MQPTYEALPARRNGDAVVSSAGALRRSLTGAALVLALVALWSLTHGYRGLVGDAKLYAFQALARIHPAFGHDLFLQDVSQDRFTVFSPVYAWAIERLGVVHAELILTLVFKLWFLVAAWWLARALSNARVACLAVGALIVLPTSYGAADVFKYLEDWVTARSPAEALVITALALYFNDRRVLGLLTAVGALLIHPLMALPGLLLLLGLSVPPRMGLLAAAAAVAVAFAIALVAAVLPSTHAVLPVMDGDWMEVVRERTPLLFPTLWSAADWKLNLRSFLALTLTMLALGDPRIRRLCVTAMLVGAIGLVISLIGSSIAWVALLDQGQAWRWLWLTSFTAVLLLAPTVRALWRDPRCGPLCALLLVCGWTLSAVDGLLCTAIAATLWLARTLISEGAARVLRGGAVAVGLVMAVWIVASCWAAPAAANAVAGREPWALTVIRDMMGQDLVPAVAAVILIGWIEANRSSAVAAALCATLAAVSSLALPEALRDRGEIGSQVGSKEFSAWRRAIAPGSNVLVVPSPHSAAFAWFVLERPSYLSADQSAGVIYSRQTTLEIRRRSEVVLPLWDTNWRLASHAAQARSGGADAKAFRPLTRESLLRVCSDPQLDFVVAPQHLGFGAMGNTSSGPWKDWNLYDCRRVKAVDSLS